MDTRKAVSIRIQQLCAEHGFNINSLAHHAGIPPTYGNSKNPGVVTVKKICDGLGISLQQFFDTAAFRSLEWEDASEQDSATKQTPAQ